MYLDQSSGNRPCLHVISLFPLSHFVGLVADFWTGSPRQGPQGRAYVIGTGFVYRPPLSWRPCSDHSRMLSFVMVFNNLVRSTHVEPIQGTRSLWMLQPFFVGHYCTALLPFSGPEKEAGSCHCGRVLS